MAIELSPDKIRDFNIRFHDVSAPSYDQKWGISFDQIGQEYVRGKFTKALKNQMKTFTNGLEIGAGTGYFGLNLMLQGIVSNITFTDISPKMLDQLQANATSLSKEVHTAVVDGSNLPFADNSFDLVFGHAILHHLPDLKQSLTEFNRVLKPGGMCVFAGEPSQLGHQISALPKYMGNILSPAWRKLLKINKIDETEQTQHEDYDLERFVDVHTFTSRGLKNIARTCGFEEINVTGEDFLASQFGWFNRSLEWSSNELDIPTWWRHYAFNGYFKLKKFDESILQPIMPSSFFYNLIFAATKR